MKQIGVLEKAAGAVDLGGPIADFPSTKNVNQGVVASAKKFQQASADAIRAATGAQ